jgi:hypothetical protein
MVLVRLVVVSGEQDILTGSAGGSVVNSQLERKALAPVAKGTHQKQSGLLKVMA